MPKVPVVVIAILLAGCGHRPRPPLAPVSACSRPELDTSHWPVAQTPLGRVPVPPSYRQEDDSTWVAPGRGFLTLLIGQRSINLESASPIWSSCTDTIAGQAVHILVSAGYGDFGPEFGTLAMWTRGSGQAVLFYSVGVEAEAQLEQIAVLYELASN